MNSFFGRAIFLIPVAFSIGLFISEYRQGLIEEDLLVQRKVAQRLGTWVPPKLSMQEIQKLESEKIAILKEISVIEARIERYKQNQQKERIQ